MMDIKFLSKSFKFRRHIVCLMCHLKIAILFEDIKIIKISKRNNGMHLFWSNYFEDYFIMKFEKFSYPKSVF